MFTRSNIRQIRQRLQDSVDQLAADLGCHIKVGSASYARDGSNCVFKIEMATLSDDGTPETKEIMDFRKFASSYGLKASDIGRQFSRSGKEFTICGLKPRSYKYPILAKSSDGIIYKFSSSRVMASLLEGGKNNG